MECWPKRAGMPGMPRMPHAEATKKNGFYSIEIELKIHDFD